jgi:ATP-binding cassette subfamily C protein
MSRLAAAIRDERTLESSLESGQDPLLAACRLVGDRLGVAIQAPRNYGETKLVDPVHAIARASGTRIRRVVLAGKWWRDENGPLLAFLREGNHPVALVPASHGYDLVDPRTGTRTAVTEEVRRDLAGSAHSFYRSFDPRPLKPSNVLRFSLFGTGRDWLTLVLLGVSAAVLGLFVPIATGWIISNVIPGADRQQLMLLVAALTVNAVVIALFEFVQEIATLRIESRMDSSVEAGVWDRLLNLPASFFRQFSTGDLTMRAMGIGHIRQVLTQAAMSSLLTFVFSLVTFVLLFYYDVRLAMIGTLLFIVVVAATVVTAFIQLPIERMQYQVRGKVAGIVLQILTGISRLRVAGAENRALAYWAGHYSRQVRLAYQSQMVANNLATFLSSVPVLSTMALFVTVAWFPSGNLSLAAFLAFSAAFAQVMGAAVSVGSTISSILDVVPLYERSKPILESLPESFAAKGDPGLLSGRIEISHVSFRYQADGPLVLDDVSMEIRPGQFVAFVGPSGAGKSTILRLLLGFETPEQGSIHFDDEDFAQLDRQAVRRQIGVVFQNSRLVAGDIFRNIIGSAPLTLDDAWEAARLSGLDEDINKMPMGMHTVISEGESTLSGGQRQRLLIARAIVTRPKMLFFDEATSALDNVTQAKVAKSLDSFKATRVVIAHRLSTIMNADRIFVIQRGKIVQQGKYGDLLSEPGLFAELAKRQLI